MIFRSKKLDKNYKFKDLKVYSSTEWLADGKKKYRSVFENIETTYLYCELSFYNKLFDEEDWEANLKIKCYRLLDKGKRDDLCEIKLDNYKISAEENIVMVREGWGNKEPGSFWSRGDYMWEAFIDDESLGKKKFYIESGGPVVGEENPYFETDRIRLYEGPNKGLNPEERTYYTQFDAKDTRYVWAEFTFQNLQAASWYCELFFHFYNDAAQLKGVTTELRRVNPEEESVTVTTGWGSDTRGSWYHDKYTLEVIFMDQLIAVVPFTAGEEYVRGESPLLTGTDMIPPQQAGAEDKQESMEELMARLDSLIGLEKIKTRIRDYIDYLKFIQVRKQQGFEESQRVNLHSVFRGNPGTGKTTIAKMLGKIYRNLGLLSNGKVHEVGRAELVGQYIGQTAPKVKEAIDKARGGVLFIDEAYSLVRSKEDTKDYGHEVIETLVKEMSDGPGDIAVIVAGYPKEMETFLDSNPGLKSRFGLYFDFPDFLPQELIRLIDLAAKTRSIEFTPEALKYFNKKLVDNFRDRDQTFGNARLVNSLVDEAKMNMGLRVVKTSDDLSKVAADMLKTVQLADVERIFRDRERVLPDIDEDQALLEEAMGELNAMIGLTEVKNQIHELIKLVRFYRETGRDILGQFSLHTIFKGNPGTGKTTVARILAKIYKALGILERGHLVECDRQALVAGYIGQTAIKTMDRIEKALGGVLFIDEAYSLVPTDISNDFGNEAIETILKQMEDRRGQFIVIAAGYPDNMDRFVEANPGLKSRFDKVIVFEDYTASDLCEIALGMLASENLQPDAEAQEYVKNYMQYLHNRRDKYFGNARSVRKLISQAVRKQHLRMAALDRSARTEEALRTITVADLKDFKAEDEFSAGKRPIGF
ncbi:MAG: AAA family ATPase [Bernardetiaceae bacterium]|jgi:SpoVK/Ycf46/Vps4 family AAA+-type ATPase|nr:AAA family ATPase [Bernardetiaceae bacterium]